MLQVQNIVPRGDKRYTLNGISFAVRQGERFGLLGGPQSGKSTVLQLLYRMQNPAAGKILLGRENIATFSVAALRRRLGYVFAQVGLFPHLSVAQNIGLSAKLLGWDAAHIEIAVRDAMAAVDLPYAAWAACLPQALSVEQQARAGMARALCVGPHMLILDEPFAAVDSVCRRDLGQLWLRISAAAKLTSILATGDVVEAFTLCQRIGVMQDGHLLQVGTPNELLGQPCNRDVAALVRVPIARARRIGRVGTSAGRHFPDAAPRPAARLLWPFDEEHADG